MSEQTDAGIGHNSVAGDELKSFVERIEKLNEEMADLREDVKSVFVEAKGNGFDVATIRKVIARRKMDAAKRQEQDAILDLYEGAIGAFA